MAEPIEISFRLCTILWLAQETAYKMWVQIDLSEWAIFKAKVHAQACPTTLYPGVNRHLKAKLADCGLSALRE